MMKECEYLIGKPFNPCHSYSLTHNDGLMNHFLLYNGFFHCSVMSNHAVGPIDFMVVVFSLFYLLPRHCKNANMTPFHPKDQNVIQIYDG